MSIEREQKFLVTSDEFKKKAFKTVKIKQGYLHLNPEKSVRIRITDNASYITIKGKSSEDGLTRYEFEQEIPYNDALELFNLCGNNVISKTRYFVDAESNVDLVWEVDVFDSFDLTLAEIETENDKSAFILPEWLGVEVTGNVEYYNSYMINRLNSVDCYNE